MSYKKNALRQKILLKYVEAKKNEVQKHTKDLKDIKLHFNKYIQNKYNEEKTITKLTIVH